MTVLAGIGVDIGGTHTEVVAVTAEFSVVARVKDRTLHADVSTLRTGTAHLVREVLNLAASSCRFTEPVPVGVGILGFVDPESGTVHGAANLPALHNPVCMGRELADELGLPVVIENDVRAGALEACVLAERKLGHPVKDVVYLSIGTGVAAVIVIGGVVLRGALGIAGDIGHAPLPGATERCNCGLTGCLETRIAGPALSRRWGTGDEETSATALFLAAEDGDARATTIVTELTRDVRELVHWLFHATGTQAVVLGGGVCTAHPDFPEWIGRDLANLAARSQGASNWAQPQRLISAPIGHPTGALGAARLACGRALTPFAASSTDGRRPQPPRPTDPVAPTT